MAKGFFIDLDGTLLDNNKKISNFTKKILKKAEENNHKVFLVTGKSYNNVYGFYSDLNLNTPLICSNGQFIILPNTQQILFELYLSNDFINEIFNDSLLKEHIKFWILESLKNLHMSSLETDSNLYRLIYSKKYKCYSNNKIIEGKYFSIYIELNKILPFEELKVITNHLNQKYKLYEFSIWFTDGHLPIIQITHASANKWKGIEKIKEIIDIDETISFGNGWTDRQMLKNTSISFAMINSFDKIKNFSTYVTAYDNNHDGVAKEIEKLI